MFGLGTGELLIILIIAFLLFGPQKLPEIARSVGRMLRRLKDEADKVNREDKDTLPPQDPKI